MTIADAKVLSEALTQFIDNIDDVIDSEQADKLRLAQFWLDHVDAKLAGLAG